MALYEYVCLNCDKTIEKQIEMGKAEPAYPCETCGYLMKRVYSPFGVSFRGGGFYSTEGRG